MIGGDSNAWTREEGGRFGLEGGDEEGLERRSMDKKVNKEEKRLIEYIKERGWSIVKGGIRDDEKRNWTYTGGREESVVDYVLVNKETREEVVNLKIGDQIDSDHHPVVIRMKDGEAGQKREEKKE